MEANALPLTKILCGKDQYIIPLFQRFYSWKRENWQRLRQDIWNLLEDDGQRVHFLGPLVCTQIIRGPGSVSSHQLIDGQQRLTTLTLLLVAIRDVAREKGFTKLDLKITEDFLIDTKEEELDRYKLLPRLGDRETLRVLVEGLEPPKSESTLMLEAYAYFRRHVGHLARRDAESTLSSLLSIIASRLMLVVVSLVGEDPYEIFESLNSTGLPLEESDLIRNFVFMQIPMKDQKAFYNHHWNPYETRFQESGEERNALNATAFYRNFLMRNGEYSRQDGTFAAFKNRFEEWEGDSQSLVKELDTFLTYELWMRHPSSCSDEDVSESLETLRMFEVNTAYPLVMHLLHEWKTGGLDKEMLLGCLQDLASFVLRRSICGETTRAYGTWFVEAIRMLETGVLRESLRGYLARRGWPTDAVFLERLVEFPIYQRESLKALRLLRFLERNMGHKERVVLDNLTIEHVMPQSLAGHVTGDEPGWKEMLGETWREVHERFVHVLGNLTLTGYNSELGNRPFSFKKKEYTKSHVELNRYFENLEQWDAAAIRERGTELADRIAQTWPAPEGAYHAKPKASVGLTPVKQRRIDYWTALAERLSEVESPVHLLSLPPETTVYAEFPGGDYAEMWAWVYNRKRIIAAGIKFKKRPRLGVSPRFLAF